MSTATLTSKGQMTLPKDIRNALKLKPGDQVEFVKVGDHYELRPRNVRAEDLAGVLKRKGQTTLTLEEMDEGISKALAEDDRRILAGR